MLVFRVYAYVHINIRIWAYKNAYIRTYAYTHLFISIHVQYEQRYCLPIVSGLLFERTA